MGYYGRDTPLFLGWSVAHSTEKIENEQQGLDKLYDILDLARE